MPVRPATAADAAACAAIYAPYVAETAISFEAEPPTVEEMAHRIAAALEHHDWLVLEDGGQVVGYAYGGPYKEREAYRWACEVSVYVERGRHRTGAGRELYEALLERLAARGFTTAVAGMTLPKRRQRRSAPRAGVRARRHVPPDRVQGRTLARCGMDPAPAGHARGSAGRPVMTLELHPIGIVESPLSDRAEAPKQGDEGAPDAWLVFEAGMAAGLQGIAPGDDLLVLTWLDRARRDVLRVHPRGDVSRGEHGVFTTRSPDRPNPIGLHRVRVAEVDGTRIRVHDLEALDGTPIIDVKPVLGGVDER